MHLGFLCSVTDGHDIVGRSLVDEVIEPVGEQQIRVASPAHHGVFGIVITGEVVGRGLDGQTCVFVPEILLFQGIAMA